MATCNILDIFPTVKFDSVKLQTTSDIQGNTVISGSSITIRYALEESVRSAEANQWFQNLDILQCINVRFIVCTSQKNGGNLDYISQRYNEFLSHRGRFNLGESETIEPSEFVSITRNKLNVPRYVFYSANGKRGFLGPGSYLTVPASPGIGRLYTPFQSSDPARGGFFRNDQQIENTIFPKSGGPAPLPMNAVSYAEKLKDEPDQTDFENFRDLIIYDQPLYELLPKVKNEQNEYVLPKRTLRSTRISEDGQETVFVYDDVPMPPLNIQVGNAQEQIGSSDIGFYLEEYGHLSVYAFVYLDQDEFISRFPEQFEVPPIDNSRYNSLVTGMTKVSSISLIGNKLEFEPLTVDTPLVGRRVKNVIDSPNRDILHDLRDISYTPPPNWKPWLASQFYSDLGASLLSDLKIEKKKNYFSNFWITKDLEENCRYIFAFDLQSFLSKRSIFGRLYSGPAAAELLQGFEYNGVEYKSQIKTMQMFREQSSLVSFVSDNDLTQGFDSKIIGPDWDYPLEKIKNPRKVRLRGANNVTKCFYEGYDSYRSNHKKQKTGRFRYHSEVHVTDVAQIFIQKAIDELSVASLKMQSILEQIIQPIPVGFYNERLGQFDRPLKDILLFKDKRTQLVEGQRPVPVNQLLREHIKTYVYWLEVLGIERLGDLSRLTFDQIEAVLVDYAAPANNRIISPGQISEVQKIIAALAQDLESLTSLRAAKILWREPETFTKEISVLQRNTLEHSIPILSEKHSFDQNFDFGYQNGLGYSYLVASDTEQNSDQHNQKQGPIRITTGGMIQRANLEVQKYFYSGDQLDNTAVDNIALAINSLQYYSPRIISTPSESENLVIDQLSDVFQTECGWDIDAYAQALKNIIKSKYYADFLSHVFYKNIDTLQSYRHDVRLYNSLDNILEQKYKTKIKLKRESEFNPLDIDPEVRNIIRERQGDDARSQRAIPGMGFGGDFDQSPSTQGSIDNLQDTLFNSDRNTGEDLYAKFDGSQEFKQAELPVKFIFGVAGELELDPGLSDKTYQEDEFNSSTVFKNVLNIRDAQVETSLLSRESPYRNLPVQMKAMVATSATRRGIFIGNQILKRVKLNDRDFSSFNNSISFYDEGYEPDRLPFNFTKDPMKIYSKMMAFIMNYKNLITVEYLDSFENSRDIGSLTNPTWAPLSREILSEENEESLLCRIRRPLLSSFFGEALNNLPENDKQKIYSFMETKDFFDLPVYNEFFVLTPGSPNPPFVEAPPADDPPEDEQAEQAEQNNDLPLEGLPDQEEGELGDDRCPPGQRRDPMTGQCVPIGGFGV